MKYLSWNETTITDFSEKNISEMYEKGYVFTRIGKGVMQQTRSLRIDLSRFELSSENRRILKKVPDLKLEAADLPLADYDYSIGKIAKDFYEDKFGAAVMSAQKIKEMMTDKDRSNFNALLKFDTEASLPGSHLGFTICFRAPSILHYSYPFYKLENASKDMGLGMMIRAIMYAKETGMRYIYLGSLQRPSDTYKLQFSGMEWFDGRAWTSDLESAKAVLSTINLPKHIHVIGICGVATSAIAIAFHERGVKVTGSDKGFFPPVSTELDKHKISFYAGWHPEKMIEDGEPDVIMIGTASGTQNPETAYANEHGIPTYSYPEIIGKYFAKENSIVCVGTWGKTSSSALLSFILSHAKLDPTYMFGGVSLSHDSSAKLTDSPWSVFEGDEYKSSPTDLRAKFFHYKPTHLLLTAVSWDHADLYPTEEEYFNAFRKLLPTVSDKGFIIACADHSGVSNILNQFKGKTVSYGRTQPIKVQGKIVDYTYKNVASTKSGLDLTISHAGTEYKIHSPMLGLFQAENITGCFAMASELGVAPEKIIEAISLFKGLKRRLEKRFEGKATVIDDIAHSPEKAISVLQTLRSIYDGKLITIFEPNIGGRSRESMAKYDNAFKDSDVVVIPRLTKLKVAEGSSEQPMEGDELAQIISKTHSNVHYIDDDEKLVDFLISNTKNDGDVIAFLGSHGFRSMIEGAIDALNR